MKKLIGLFLLLWCVYSYGATTLIIPAGPGGGLEASARHMEKYFLDRKNIKMVVMYKPGAEGLVGLQEIAKSTDTNSVVGLVTIASLAEASKNNLDFEYITATHKFVAVLATNSKTKIKNYKEFIKKVNSNNSYAYGHNSSGQISNFNQLISNTGSNSDIVKVPYKGAGAVVIDLLAGNIDFIMLPYSLVKQYIDSGKLTVLASTTSIPELVNIPAVEKKYKNWLDITGYCFILPKGAANLEIEFWTKNLQDYLNDPETKEYYKTQYATAYPFGPVYIKTLIKKINNE
jgi:tripartite-type tricarboxylate transporter receptor subunit TctC